ncbi:MAG: hypothetical protein CMO55_24050 [Verrucomicrobiales bacterium]|nr:hypothetical protein [Verrucomicrobiales bacterium]
MESNKQPSKPASQEVEDAWKRSSNRLLSLQLDEGGWEGEVVWCPILPAQYVIVCYFIGRKIPEEEKQKILKQFEYTRHEDGLWGMHPDSQPYLFVTTLVYVASRLLGMDGKDELLIRAQEFITSGKGVLAIPSWGKFWLALMHLFEWKGVRPILPELWLIPKWIALHPSNYYCHTRLIYAPMAFLYGRKSTTQEDESISKIREELFPEGYSQDLFDNASSMLRGEEVCSPPGRALKCFYFLGHLFESMPFKPLRKIAEKRILQLIRDDLETTGGRFISPMSGLLSIVTLHVAGGTRAELDYLFNQLKEWIFVDDVGGMRIAGARSMTWDTAFALQALGTEIDTPGIQKAREALAREQILSSSPTIGRQFRSDPMGGFCFGHASHFWPVSDCTAEALVALLQNKEDLTISKDRIESAVNFILSRQNPDGGFGSYEARRCRSTLDWLNPAEMFGNSMVEHSWVECTASCIEALVTARAHLGYQKSSTEYQLSLQSESMAAAWLLKQQKHDGSWFGGWGICYLYGTMFGIRGLIAGGSKHDAAELIAAGNWLVSKQHEDGSWGESHEASYHEKWIDGPPNCTQTAWALIGLQSLKLPQFQEPIERGISFLVEKLDENGNWPDQRGTGIFFRSAVLDYRLYRRIFPLRALLLHKRNENLECGAGVT